MATGSVGVAQGRLQLEVERVARALRTRTGRTARAPWRRRWRCRRSNGPLGPTESSGSTGQHAQHQVDAAEVFVQRRAADFLHHLGVATIDVAGLPVKARLTPTRAGAGARGEDEDLRFSACRRRSDRRAPAGSGLPSISATPRPRRPCRSCRSRPERSPCPPRAASLLPGIVAQILCGSRFLPPASISDSGFASVEGAG